MCLPRRHLGGPADLQWAGSRTPSTARAADDPCTSDSCLVSGLGHLAGTLADYTMEGTASSNNLFLLMAGVHIEPDSRICERAQRDEISLKVRVHSQSAIARLFSPPSAATGLAGPRRRTRSDEHQGRLPRSTVRGAERRGTARVWLAPWLATRIPTSKLYTNEVRSAAR